MICQNAILSDEYMDYIWKADVNPPAEMDLLPYGVCAQYISPSFSVYYISRKEVFWQQNITSNRGLCAALVLYTAQYREP